MTMVEDQTGTDDCHENFGVCGDNGVDKDNEEEDTR